MSTYDRFSTQLAVLYMMDGLLFTTEEDTSLDSSDVPEQKELLEQLEDKINSDVEYQQEEDDEEELAEELKHLEDNIKSGVVTFEKDLKQNKDTIKSDGSLTQSPDPISVADFGGGKKRRRSKKNGRK